MLTTEELKQILRYNALTGEFTWVACPGPRKSGTPAGRRCGQGYKQIQINGRTYRASRLAWLYFYGEWPSSQLDHANRQRDDDRIANLRLATPSQNTINRRLKSTVGLRGTTKIKGGWQAQIGIGGKRLYLGTFPTAEQAHAAYQAAAADLHKEFRPDR